MSYSFYVEAGAPPEYRDVLEALPEVETSSGPAEELEGPWEPGHVLAVWTRGWSTRPVELAWSDGTFSARILACACAEDYDLALDAVCHVADMIGAEVESEEGVRFAPDARTEHYGADWILPHVSSMVTTVIAHARETDGWVTMPGTTRDFHIGPRLAEEIGKGSAHAQEEALFARMRALFYPDEERLYAANVLSVTLDDGSHFTTTALAPGVGYVFPPVDYLTILATDPFEIPFAALPEIVGEDEVVWMDEACPSIAAIDDDEWDAFEAKARAHAVDPRGRKSLPHIGPEAPAPTFPWALVLAVLLAIGVVIWVLTR
ncbi:MAG: hypothetical protein KC619_28760 [Myxococcales bacterium]|nr:hypothetical protein [Myxococcales bacterium]